VQTIIPQEKSQYPIGLL